MKEISLVRPSPIAGSWYPGNRDALLADIRSYVEATNPPQVEGKIYGLIAPHAGYFYSGATAGYAYRCVQGETFDICAVFSPLHDYQPYDLLTSAHVSYATPLGEIPIETELITEINSKLGVPMQLIAYDREHSLEIQLPFLQTVLANSFKLVPIMVRTHEPEVLKETARIVSEALKGKRTLVIASTDLSHFYPLAAANAYDKVMTSKFSHFDPTGVLEAEARNQGFACGAGAVALALWTTQFLGAKQVTLLHHSTSAEASGDSSSVVGYAAAAIAG
jgi:AmmeMemoRadiSam system protein B